MGGAGNVAAAAAALGATADCVGAIGSDPHGDELKAMLDKIGADTSAMVRLADRPTALKTRYVGLAQHRHAQQMLRVDQEQTQAISPQAQEPLLAAVRARVGSADIVGWRITTRACFRMSWRRG